MLRDFFITIHLQSTEEIYLEETYQNYIRAYKKGDSDKFNLILKPINPCIQSYAYRLKYPEAHTDLIIYLLELLKKIDLRKFKTDKEIQAYLKKCIRNKAINLSKNYLREREKTSYDSEVLNIILESNKFSHPIGSDLCFKDLISNLNSKQQQILLLKFKNNFTDKEIGNELKISRQAVNKQKIKALKILKKELEK